MCTVLPKVETLPGLSRGRSRRVGGNFEKQGRQIGEKRDWESSQAARWIRFSRDAERLRTGAELRAADKYAELNL